MFCKPLLLAAINTEELIVANQVTVYNRGFREMFSKPLLLATTIILWCFVCFQHPAPGAVSGNLSNCILN